MLMAEFGQYMVRLNLDEFMIGKPVNCSLHHEPLINSCQNIYKNPSTKLDVWDDQMRNPASEMCSSAEFTMENYQQNHGEYLNWNMNEESFLHGQAPLMTKIDEEYLNWQRQQSADQLESRFEEEKEKMSVVERKTADSNEKNNGGVVSERRRIRMIKNRESAARSRARKQAYINQLKQDVSKLRASNQLLRKRKEADTLLNCKAISAPRYQLRRTSSTQF